MSHPGDLLSALVDGELEPARRQEVITHLAECDTCREELDDVVTARKLLRELPSPPLPALPGRRRAIGWVAGLVLLAGIGAAIGGAGSDEIPAGELAVMLGAYTAAGPAVASVVPVTAAAAPVSVELPAALGDMIRTDLRLVGEAGVLAHYRSGGYTVAVFASPHRLDVDGLGAEEVEVLGGSYLRAEGRGSVLYVWRAEEAWIALLAMAPETTVRQVLADLPPPVSG